MHGFTLPDVRPFICVKDPKGRNWLIPVTSLDPDKPNFENKSKIIAKQTKSEANLSVKVLARLSDILGRKKGSYESILTFNKAVPVKGKDVQPYFDIQCQHAKARLDEKTCRAIKKNLYGYLANYYKDKPSGFLIGYCANGKTP
ncbi:MAG: hypothetical protein FWC80_06105 [Firmicutes bacterium]|nr:hypothetical protein [Bacillota bacterium]